MRIVKTFLGKVRGAPQGVDAAIFQNLSTLLGPLNKVESGLAGKVTGFICTGKGEANLLTLESNSQAAAAAMKLTDYWQLSWSQQSAYRGLIWDPGPRDPAIMYRLGRAFAAASGQISASHYGLIGSKKSPMWLRLLASMPLWVRNYVDVPKNADRLGWLSVENCRAVLQSAGESEFALLDIAVDPHKYYFDQSDQKEPMVGLTDYLRENAQQAAAHAEDLIAAKRVELCHLLGRFELVDRYQAFLLKQAVASAKTVREAAQAALHGVSVEALVAPITELLETGTATERAHAAGFTVSVLRERARPVLEARLEEEKGKRVRDAIALALQTIDLVSESEDAADTGAKSVSGAAGESVVEEVEGNGFVALDGSIVQWPECPPLPEDTPVPEAAVEHLERAAESYNDGLRAYKARADRQQRRWLSGWNALTGGDIRDYISHLNGKKRHLGRPYGHGLASLTHRNFLFEFDTAGVAAFFNHDALTAWHLIRDVRPTQDHGYYFQWTLFDTLGRPTDMPSLTRLRAMLAEGLDIRVPMNVSKALGATDPLAAYLGAIWDRSLASWEGSTLWYYCADNLELIDEALGLKPQSGDRALQKLAGLEVLALFPKVPKRYLSTLMDLSSGTAKTLRDPARRLLTGAPQIDTAIAALLQDGKQDTRAGAAEWLAARQSVDQITDLRAALKTERSEVARAAILSALERLGDDISDQFSETVLLNQAEKGLAKALPKALHWYPFDALPALTWKDGAPLNPKILKWWIILANKLKQPGGNALFDLYLERLQPEDAQLLGQAVLGAWTSQDTVGPTDEEANAYAKANADSSYAYMRKWMPEITLDSVFNMLKREKRSQYLNSAIANKGLLALCVRLNGADAAERVKAYLKNHGSRTAQCKALIDCLASNPSPAAIQVVLATANRFKAKTVQSHAQERIESIAQLRGWTPDELGDRTIPSAGLDETGHLDLDCGFERTYSLLYDLEGKIVLRNPSGKEVKSLPSARNDEEQELIKAAKKAVSTARKEVKQVNSLQTARLFEAMCTERAWNVTDWLEFLQKHPVVGRLVQRLVWLGIGADGNIVRSFRPLEDGSLSGSDDEPVSHEGLHSVRLAHQALLGTDAATQWLQHFSDYEIAPLFAQFGRPSLQLDEALKTDTKIDDRKGHMIETFRLRGAATKLGYERGENLDGGAFMDYVKRYQGLGIQVMIGFTGSYLPEENIASALTDLMFVKTGGGSWGNAGPLALGDVPVVLLSECWNDLHEIASAGTGYDKDWESKGLL